MIIACSKLFQDFLFVPGGRVFKMENISSGIDRVLKNELGKIFDYNFFGIYEHMYLGDNCGGDPNIDSHYIVFTIHIILKTCDLNEEQFKKGEYYYFISTTTAQIELTVNF